MCIGVSGSTKIIPATTFIDFMNLVTERYKCKFFLATGKDIEEQKILHEILETNLKEKCHVLDNLSISALRPRIKNCNIAICNESSFRQSSAGIGIKREVLMEDKP